MTPRTPTRVGVIGFGAIGAPIIAELRNGRIPGCALSGIIARSHVPDELKGFSTSSIYDLIDRSDLVVEAAGHSALVTLGPPVIDEGKDLLVLSVGALADDELLARLSKRGGGRLLVSTGAVGGLDILAAAMLMEPLDSVSLTSRKPSNVLVRPWMDEQLQEVLKSGGGETKAFDGTAREAVALFPESANIAATLALATVGFDHLNVRIIGVPGASEVEHHVQAVGRAGSYDFVFRNRPDSRNPRTSAITPFSVIRALRGLQAHTVVGI